MPEKGPQISHICTTVLLLGVESRVSFSKPGRPCYGSVVPLNSVSSGRARSLVTSGRHTCVVPPTAVSADSESRGKCRAEITACPNRLL